MVNSVPTAPDSHWLLVKSKWLPIEHLIAELEPGEDEDVVTKINRLRSRLDETVIARLHQLRKDRNDLMHTNLPLKNIGLWETTADLVRKDLEALRVGTPGDFTTFAGRKAVFLEHSARVEAKIALGVRLGQVMTVGAVASVMTGLAIDSKPLISGGFFAMLTLFALLFLYSWFGQALVEKALNRRARALGLK